MLGLAGPWMYRDRSVPRAAFAAIRDPERRLHDELEARHDAVVAARAQVSTATATTAR